MRITQCEPISLSFHIAGLRKAMRDHFGREAALVEAAGTQLCSCHRNEHDVLLELCDEPYAFEVHKGRSGRALLRNKLPKLVRDHYQQHGSDRRPGDPCGGSLTRWAYANGAVFCLSFLDRKIFYQCSAVSDELARGRAFRHHQTAVDAIRESADIPIDDQRRHPGRPDLPDYRPDVAPKEWRQALGRLSI